MVLRLPQHLFYPCFLLDDNRITHQIHYRIMSRMNTNLRNALKATLNRVAELHPDGVLMCGIDYINQQAFCKLIKVERNLKKLLSCSRIEIRGIGYSPSVEKMFVSWLKANIQAKTKEPFCNNLLSPHNWLRYNIAGDLQILQLSVAKKEYYMILKDEHLRYFRNKAFNQN